MALRLRRGTEAERLSITPLEGELIYATDTQRLYIGDGTTLGGVAILDPTRANFSINDLIDVDTNDGSTIPGDGELLAWDADNQRWRPVPVSSNVNNLGDLGDVDLTLTPNDNDILRYNSVASKWESESLANVPINITDLADVDTQSTAPQNGDILQWDQNTLRWIPTAAAFAGGGITEGASYFIKVTDPTGKAMLDPTSRLVRGNLFNDADVEIISANSQSGKLDIRADDNSLVLVRGASSNVSEFRGITKGTLQGATIKSGDGLTTYLTDGGIATLSSVDAPIMTTSNLSAGSVRIAGITGSNIISTTTASTSLVLATLDTNQQVISTRPLSVGGSQPTVPSGFITVFNDTNGGVMLRMLNNVENSGDPIVAVNRSRGTKAAPTAVQIGDGLGNLAFTGHNGVGYRGAGGIRVTVTGSPQAGRVPGEVQLYTVTTGGLPDPVITFGLEKNTSFAGAIRPATYSDSTARDAAIPGPELGMMVFNISADKFQGYTSTGWVDLN